MEKSQLAICEDAVILAGGLGTRLGRLTESTPKPLVHVGGQPFLYYQLRLLKKHGIKRILLLTGYLGEQIEESFGNGASMGLQLSYHREPEPMGTGGALKLARHMLAPEFFLVYGDSYLDIDYQQAYRGFANLRLPGMFGMMVVYEQGGGNDDPGNVRLDPTGTRVISYHKGRGADHYHIDAGVLILSAEVCDLIPSGEAANLEEFVYPKLASEGRMLAFSSPTRFYDIGTPERLANFERSID
jgi:NDP-sugar pyrophosphorylase family protein